MLGDEQRGRLRQAGERFQAATRERDQALTELRAALAEADGNTTPAEAAEITGLGTAISAVLLGHD